MKGTRKTVIVIASVLAVAGIASAVTGTIIKKKINVVEYKVASVIEASDIGKRYSVKLNTENILESADDLYCYQIEFLDEFLPDHFPLKLEVDYRIAECQSVDAVFIHVKIHDQDLGIHAFSGSDLKRLVLVQGKLRIRCAVPW